MIVLQGDFLVLLVAGEVILFTFIMVFYITKNILFRSKSQINNVSIKTSPLESFHHSLSKIIGTDSGEGTFQTVPLEAKLSKEISVFKAKLQKHEIMLYDVIEQWKDIYHAPAPYMGMTTIRRCMEKLLYHRLRANGIKIKKKTNRGLATMRNLLVREDDLSSEALQHLDVIAGMTNPTAHDFDMNENNYITSLSSFAEFVDWHFDNPVGVDESE